MSGRHITRVGALREYPSLACDERLDDDLRLLPVRWRVFCDREKHRRNALQKVRKPMAEFSSMRIQRGERSWCTAAGRHLLERSR